MTELHIWNVSALLESTLTDRTYPMDFKVVTKTKFFSEAELVAFDTIDSKINDSERYKDCEYDGLSALRYDGIIYSNVEVD